MSVPYAMYATMVDTVLNAPDTSSTNEIQNLSVSTSGDTLYISGSNYVIVPGISVKNFWPSGIVFCGTPTAIVDVTSTTTGKTWMDRNLGASQVATSSTDADSYGDLYQWGRAADGHQCRTTSMTTSTLSNSDTPVDGKFITSDPDWRNPSNDNLWQGVNGTNNPCPNGYRLPTDAEWTAEMTNFGITHAFNSPLKLPAAGYRDKSNGQISSAGSLGYYWSSTTSTANSNAEYFQFWSEGGGGGPYPRARGGSVRCIKHE
jgi:uncharacterized protein (TIGR02145 family)